MTDKNFNFEDTKRGDSFYPPKDNTDLGGVVFLVSEMDDPDQVKVTLEFKDERGYSAYKFDNDQLGGITNLGLSTEGKGAYRIESFIWEKPARIYMFDLELQPLNGSVKSTSTGFIRIIQDIANSNS